VFKERWLRRKSAPVNEYQITVTEIVKNTGVSKQGGGKGQK